MTLELNPATPECRTVRILWLESTGEYALLIDVFQRKAKPYQQRCFDLEQALVDGTARPVPDPYVHLMLPDDRYSDARIRARDKEVAALEPLITASAVDQFDLHKRAKLITAISSRDKGDQLYRDKPCVYRRWRRFCQRGQMPNALLPDSHKAGWTSEKRAQRRESKKLGRDRTGTTPSERRAGLVLTKDLEDTLFDIGKLYWETRTQNGRKRSWPEALQLGCERYFNNGFAILNGVRTPIMPPLNELPSLTQLKRVYFDRASTETSVRSREGEKAFNSQYRPLTSDQRSLANGPMQVVQCDSTLADIYLVDCRTRKAVGRPTLTLIRDTMSRLIVGFSVSLESEGWTTAALAIENMARDKLEYCASLGIEISPEWWPSHHLPERFLVDNGAMITAAAARLRCALRLEIDNTGSSRGDLKGLIESGFNDINRVLIHRQLGAVLPASRHRGAEASSRRSPERAVLDIHEFRCLVVHYILHFNRFRVLKDYPLADDMKGVVAPIPLKLWEWGIANRSGFLREEPLDLVRLHCLRPAQATVTRKGILFEGAHYECQRSRDEGWPIKAGVRGSWRVDIVYDPRNMEFVYLRRDSANAVAGQPLVEACTRLRSEGERVDIDLAEQRLELQRGQCEVHALEQGRPQTTANLNAEIARIEQEAIKKTASANGSQRQKLVNLRPQREAAKAEERANSDAFGILARERLEGPVGDNGQTPDALPQPDDSALEKIRRVWAALEAQDV